MDQLVGERPGAAAKASYRSSFLVRLPLVVSFCQKTKFHARVDQRSLWLAIPGRHS